MNSAISADLRQDLLDDFYLESDQHLKIIREALVLMEQSVGKAQADRAIVEELFRSFHSFKGISAIIGLRTAEELAHACEEYLRELTRGRVSLTAQALEVLMSAAQKLEQMVVAFSSGNPPPDSDALLSTLRNLAGQESQTGKESDRQPGSESEATDSEEAENAERLGLLLWRCTFVPTRELDQRGVNINAVRARLSRVGKILYATPQVRSEGVVAFEMVLGTRETPPDITTWEADGLLVEPIEPNATARNGPGISAPESVSEPAQSPFIAPSHLVRVDLHKLDELMRITGEMVIHRSRFEEQLIQSARAPLDRERLQEIHTSLARSLRDLRQAIMHVRLVPVAEIFARMPFVVRDLARGTAKQVQLKLEGQQTQLDKYLIERLKDPLLHLVRNAFSHGVEIPEERAAAGKRVEATIVLAASTRGDSVLIEVRDDGRGIDSNEVARRAAVLGLAVSNPLDNSALLKVLCSPGFSTREDADRVSGRGMGMAVVYSTVRELGGNITLDTTPGQGTRFTLRLPLTLAISETLIVSDAEQTCAIPQSFVSEVLQIEERQIRVVNGVEVIPYRSGVLPIVRLSTLFRATQAARDRSCVLVLTSERGSTGLVVGRIHGQREVVVRSIRDPLVQVPAVMGATELGDGRAVLILDGAALTSGPVRPHPSVAEAAAARTE